MALVRKPPVPQDGSRNLFPKARVYGFRYKFGYGARGVKLAVFAGALQVFKDGFVNVAEDVAVFRTVEVYLVKFIQDLADNGAVLHVIVGAVEDLVDDKRPLVPGADIQVFKGWGSVFRPQIL